MAALLIATGIGLFLYSRQMKSIAPGAGSGPTSPRATIDMAGVKNDLLAFANAEKQQYALEGKYLSLDDLRAKGTTLPRDTRGPFTYSAEIGDSSFRIVATYSGEPQAGVPKTMSIDDSMQIASQQ